MKRVWLLATLVLSVALVGGCQTGRQPASEQTGSLSPLPTPGAETGSPSPGSLLQIPTPAGDLAVVTGIILRGSPAQPVQQAILYLGQIQVSESGTPVVTSLNKQTAPRSTVDATGRFVFADVPPGDYALVLDLISSTVVLRNPTGGGDLIVKAQAGKVTDLGSLTYPDLPSLP